MGYQGEELKSVPSGLDFSYVYAVIVSGDGPNPCGHALLYVPFASGMGAGGGYYFQIAGVYKYPHVMDNAGYERYIKENGKSELSRYMVRVPKPGDAEARLKVLVGEKWFWAVLPHNCAAFVEDVVQAGGSSAGLYSNCPSREKFEPNIFERTAEFLEREIRRLYGVPF
jgi:hypothetical protein